MYSLWTANEKTPKDMSMVSGHNKMYSLRDGRVLNYRCVYLRLQSHIHPMNDSVTQRLINWVVHSLIILLVIMVRVLWRYRCLRYLFC